MKSNFKRFLGILLATLLVVTMLPAMSFAEDIADDTVVDEPVIEDSVSDVPSGASFVIDDKTFILMDSTNEIDGKTYYGVLSNEKLSYAWYHATPYMETDDGVIDMDNEVTLYVMDDRQYDFENKTISEDKRTDIQSYVTKFAPFGDFVAPEDTVWTLHQGNADIGKVYFKGSVGLPTANQLNAVLATDELPFGSDESRYLVKNVGFWNGVYYWSRLQPGENPSNANFFINNIAGLTASNGGGGTWYFMTYVSEDFFKTTKLDVPTVGTKARETLAANFYQRDFAAAGYTEEELAELGIPAQPEDAESSIEWSPNYVKFAGLDLLFNDTITKDGKTHFGFIWANDFGGSNVSNQICSIQMTSPETDIEGNPMPSINYGGMNLTTGDRTSLGSFEEYVMNEMPEVVTDNLLLYDWLIGETYGMLPAQNYAQAKSYLRMKVVIPSEEEATKHLTYLLPMVDNNAENNRDANNTGKFLATRTGKSYSLRVYNATTEQWASTGNDRWIGTSSSFPTFYLSEDAFVAEKVDISSLGENVKTAMAETFNKLDLSDIYTETELDALGIPELPCPEGSTFVVDGKKYILLSDTKVVDGKNYYAVMNTDSLYAPDGYGVMEFTPNDNSNETTKYMDVNLKVLHGLKWDLGSGLYNLQELEDTYFPATAFDGYLLNNDWTIVDNWTWGSEGTFRLAYNGKVGIPTFSMVTEALGKGLTLTTNAFTTSLSYYERDNYTYINGVKPDGTSQQMNAYQANDNLTYKSGQYGELNLVAYVDEDFFLNTKLDLAETSATVREMLSSHYQYEFAPNLYSAKEYDVLGIEPFGEESKSAADASNSFVVGGENYLISSNIVEENGKKYFLVMNSTHLATDQGDYGRITESVFDEEASTDTTKIFSDFKLGANYGDLEKTPTQKFKGSRSMADEYQDIYFPSSVFGDNLKMHDWKMATGWTWSDGNLVDVYHRAYMGLPTVAEVNAFNAIDPLSKQYGAMVETRTFTDNWSWKRMHLANLNGGETGSGSIVGADNFAYKENGQGKFFFVAYVSEDFFKGTDIDMTTAGDGFKSIVKANFERADLTGWTKANLDLLYAGYDGAGLGLEVVKTANGADVVIHNNGTEADGKGTTIIVAAYENGCFKGLKTMVLIADVSANAKTLPFSFDLDEGAEVKAMFWSNLKPKASVASAQ